MKDQLSRYIAIWATTLALSGPAGAYTFDRNQIDSFDMESPAVQSILINCTSRYHSIMVDGTNICPKLGFFERIDWAPYLAWLAVWAMWALTYPRSRKMILEILKIKTPEIIDKDGTPVDTRNRDTEDTFEWLVHPIFEPLVEIEKLISDWNYDEALAKCESGIKTAWTNIWKVLLLLKSAEIWSVLWVDQWAKALQINSIIWKPNWIEKDIFLLYCIQYLEWIQKNNKLEWALKSALQSTLAQLRTCLWWTLAPSEPIAADGESEIQNDPKELLGSYINIPSSLTEEQAKSLFLYLLWGIYHFYDEKNRSEDIEERKKWITAVCILYRLSREPCIMADSNLCAAIDLSSILGLLDIESWVAVAISLLLIKIWKPENRDFARNIENICKILLPAETA